MNECLTAEMLFLEHLRQLVSSATQEQSKHEGQRTVLIRPGTMECDAIFNHNLSSDSFIVTQLYRLAKSQQSKMKFATVDRHCRKLQCYQTTWDGTNVSVDLFETEIKRQSISQLNKQEVLIQQRVLHHLTPLSFDPIQHVDGIDHYLVGTCIIQVPPSQLTVEFWLRAPASLLKPSKIQMCEMFKNMWHKSPIMVKLIPLTGPPTEPSTEDYKRP